MQQPQNPPASILLRAAAPCLVLALAGAGYLLANALIHGPIAGCGEGSGCDSVLKSRFAYLLPGVPVSLPAIIVYAALLVCVLMPARTRESAGRRFVALAAAALVVGAALCFVAIQAWVLDKFCPYCMATHTTGVLGALLAVTGVGLLRGARPAALAGPVLAAAAALAAMLGLQYFFPQKTYAEGAGPETRVSDDGRVFSIGATAIRLADVPHRGNEAIDNPLIILFDYTCHTCRKTHRYLHRAEERFGMDKLLVIGMPVPLNPKCNPGVTEASAAHTDACEHARLALALWHVDPEAFRNWDRWMFETGSLGAAPAPADALAKAESLVDAAALGKALADPWVDEQLERNIALWEQFKSRLNSRSMPQMVMGGRIFKGAPGSEFELYDMMRAHLGLERATPGGE